MSAHIIPAASNALMLKHFESQGFDRVYLDSRLVSTQLLGTYDTDLLSTTAYLNYVQRLAAVTKMAVIADIPDNVELWTLPTTIQALQKIGCRQVILSDANLENAEALDQILTSAQQATTDENFEIIVKLDGFINYGLDELQTRIDIAQANGVNHILISNITNGDIAIIKAVATTALISLIIDNANINYCGAEQLNPEFILDTYHVYAGLTRAARTISQDMVLKIFMG
ncbi:isocitrate lyase/phosphoenolpyruvate mutase family protein [Agrilactobacillus yilanensis]|nr:isocitrate lyase/phosphoenolpyruvate mutase family protein [Agrilactobacillus yilanensis]